MISKGLIFLLVFLLYSDAVRRGGSSKSRIGSHSYSSGNLSNESPKDPGRAILAVIFMILSCGSGISWKIYKCYRNGKRRKFIQSQLPYPNNLYRNSMLTSSVNRLNEIDLSSKISTLVSLSVESLDYTSGKLIYNNTLEQIQVQKPTSEEEL